MNRTLLAICFLISFTTLATAQVSSTVENLNLEVEQYVAVKSRELTAAGKRPDRDKLAALANEKKSLAKKYAAEAAARPNLAKTDFYFLGVLFFAAEDNPKAFDAMKTLLNMASHLIRPQCCSTATASSVISVSAQASTKSRIWKI